MAKKEQKRSAYDDFAVMLLKEHGSACKNTAFEAESFSDIPTAVFSAKFVPSCGGGMEETK